MALPNRLGVYKEPDLAFALWKKSTCRSNSSPRSILELLQQLGNATNVNSHDQNRIDGRVMPSIKGRKQKLVAATSSEL